MRRRTSTTLSEQLGSGLFAAQQQDGGTPGRGARGEAGPWGHLLDDVGRARLSPDDKGSKGRGRATARQSVLTMVNAVLGAGVLGFPYVFKSCGLVLASLLVGGVVASSALSMRLLLLASRRAGVATYEGLAARGLGRAGRLCVDACVLALNLGSLVAYLSILADTAGTVAGTVVPPGAEPRREAILAALTLLIALPVTLSSRSAPLLAAVSQASVTFLLFFGAATALTALAPEAPVRDLLLWRPAGALLALPVVVYGFTAHQVLFSIYQALQSASVHSMTRVINHSMALSTGMYLTVGAAGYVAYGPGTAGDLLRNLGGSERAVARRAFERALRVGYGLSVLGTLPLVLLPLRACALRALRAVIAATLCLMLLDAGFLAGACVLAIAVPNVEFAFGLAGSTASLLLAYVLPGLIFLRCGGSGEAEERDDEGGFSTLAAEEGKDDDQLPRHWPGRAPSDSVQELINRSDSTTADDAARSPVHARPAATSSRRRLEFDLLAAAARQPEHAPEPALVSAHSGASASFSGRLPASPAHASVSGPGRRHTVGSPVRRSRGSRVQRAYVLFGSLGAPSAARASRRGAPILGPRGLERVALFLVVAGLIAVVLCTHALATAVAREARGHRAAQAAASGALARTEAAHASGLTLAAARLQASAGSVAELARGLRVVSAHLEQRGGAAGTREAGLARTALHGAVTRLDAGLDELQHVADGLGAAAAALRSNSSADGATIVRDALTRAGVLENGELDARQVLPWRRGPGSPPPLLPRSPPGAAQARPLLHVTAALSEADVVRHETAGALEDVEQSVRAALEAVLTARMTADGARARLARASRALAPRRAAEGLVATLGTLEPALAGARAAAAKLEGLASSRVAALGSLLRSLDTQRAGRGGEKSSNTSASTADSAPPPPRGRARAAWTWPRPSSRRSAPPTSAKTKAAESIQDSQREDAQRALEIAKVITKVSKESQQVLQHAEEHHANQTQAET
ncbi:hypothetical protein QBZ16_005008 [Prototheca wickerhamii]|uniref:Amino acid transporter transmembrane domain-containing protein n=1 Tax=Prototheca wickerhamii TaxID=3111 RepID=A0AAD9IIJ1_PROWI|nr:hypothetical protein QBZ16_005008 [Prototheca wickerhamii]